MRYICEQRWSRGKAREASKVLLASRSAHCVPVFKGAACLHAVPFLFRRTAQFHVNFSQALAPFLFPTTVLFV